MKQGQEQREREGEKETAAPLQASEATQLPEEDICRQNTTGLVSDHES